MPIWLISLIYLMSFLAGLATAWGFATLGVANVFDGGHDSLSLAMGLPVLAGISAFSLVYGPATGRALKWRFWLIVPVAVAILFVGMTWVVFRGWLSPLHGFVAGGLILFVAGYLAALQRDATTGAPAGQS